MARTPQTKLLENTRLASTYGGWIYCEGCGNNIGYLCYVTYDHFQFNYKCKCGACGKMQIDFEEKQHTEVSEHTPIIIKNRLCCPNDQSPLLTILKKNLDFYSYKIQCVKCNTIYAEEKTL